MIVTDVERNGYYNFALSELKKLAPSSIPKVLWHYTTGTKLINIIETHSLWMTQISCLNDYSEMRYAVDLLRRSFRDRRLSATLASDEEYLCDRIETALSVDVVPTSDWFVFCLSEERDDLSQWRAYGDGEGGFAIGFDSNSLVFGALPTGYFLARVTYDRSAHAALMTSIVTATLQFFMTGVKSATKGTREQWADAFLPVWADALTWLIPVIKDDAFAAEREWRVVHRLQPADTDRMKYVQRRMMMSRHLPIDFPAVGGKVLLPISEIVVGPSRYKPISRVSVGDLLRTHHYVTANVSESRIPFQTL
jgi:hypothetical protein